MLQRNNYIINYNYSINCKSLDINCRNCQGTLQRKTTIKSKNNKLYILQSSLFLVDNLHRISKITDCKISKLPVTEIFIDNKYYKMINTIFHHGTNISSGHYTNMLKISNKWMKVNDSNVEISKWPYCSKDAYIIVIEETNC